MNPRSALSRLALFGLGLLFLLVGCNSYSPVPEGYTGEVATLRDSAKRRSVGSAYMFFAKKIDGRMVTNIARSSRSASYGMGNNLTISNTVRKLPLRPVTLTLVAEVIYAAPIVQMFDRDHSKPLEGEVTFTPEANKNYSVKGTMNLSYSAVWIEDSEGREVTKRIEVRDRSHSAPTMEFYSPPESPTEPYVLAPGQAAFIPPWSRFDAGTVLKGLGAAAEIVPSSSSVFSRQMDRETHIYPGLGRIEIRIDDNGNKWIESRTPSLVEAERAEFYAQAIFDTRNSIFIRLAGIRTHEDMTTDLDQATTDRIARNIWYRRYDTNDEILADGLAWWCKVLGKYGNPRYREFFTALLEDQVDEQVRRFAKNMLKAMDDRAVEQFTPTDS
jgi:hypothetical protein